jgi:hypothetical protein
MAQTKTRASAKARASAKRPQKPNKPQARAPRARTRSSNGKARARAARQAVESTTKEAGHTMGQVAGKAKTPLLAGGAALAGAAGGLAIGAMQSRHSRHRKVLGVKVPQGKRVKVRSRDVARAAKEVGNFGQQVGELATELRHTREEGNGNPTKHRSPVEVLLDGLTARR